MIVFPFKFYPSFIRNSFEKKKGQGFLRVDMCKARVICAELFPCEAVKKKWLENFPINRI